MDVLLQTLGVLAVMVIGARLLPMKGAAALVPVCLLVAAALFLAPFPSNAREQIRTAEQTYGRLKPLSRQDKEATSFVAMGIPTNFVEWFRGRMQPGETYFWARGPTPAGLQDWFRFHNQWVTYRMLPYLAVASPREADVVMLYNVSPRRWRRNNPAPARISMYSDTYGVARLSR
jgi:hypothetical protein